MASCVSSQAQGLPISDLQVKITSKGHTATFRLYNTAAAKEFYDQLPLRLDLSNFRDAQWMFYPPQKLNVTPAEAYHDGKKGELSYYAPWGDVFMLYKDFYAGDEMHRLGINLTGSDEIEKMSGIATIEKKGKKMIDAQTAIRISIIANGKKTVFQLNNSAASKALYTQLPLNIKVDDYSNNEKIFYPPEKLNTTDAKKANARAGTLAYYAPWGNVVMFFGNFGSAEGLYELGHAVSGSDHIKDMAGMIRVEKDLVRPLSFESS